MPLYNYGGVDSYNSWSRIIVFTVSGSRSPFHEAVYGRTNS